jgi:ABC-type thiamine transport system ATPase subunit
MVEVPPGQLLIDGVDITAMALPALRAQVALVPQEGYLFTATLADNLRYGAPEAQPPQVENAARQARLEQDIKGFPDGYATLVGERGITLSGGQRQRTALGRALLVDAPLLVLDDALLATFADELEEFSDDADQKLKVLEICMGRMTPRQRELIAARYGRGEAVQDIASRLSRSENAMAALYYRLRKLLADCVQSVLGNEVRA